jgi:hypothetical protein
MAEKVSMPAPDTVPSETELRVARLVAGGMPYEQARRLAPHIGDDPERDLLGAGGETPGRRFLSLSAIELAELPPDEFRRGLRAATREGLL